MSLIWTQIFEVSGVNELITREKFTRYVKIFFSWNRSIVFKF